MVVGIAAVADRIRVAVAASVWAQIPAAGLCAVCGGGVGDDGGHERESYFGEYVVAAVAVGEAAADGGGAVVVAAVKEQEKMARVVPVPNCARWFQSDRNDRLDAWHPAARLIDLGEHVE